MQFIKGKEKGRNQESLGMLISYDTDLTPDEGKKKGKTEQKYLKRQSRFKRAHQIHFWPKVTSQLSSVSPRNSTNNIPAMLSLWLKSVGRVASVWTQWWITEYSSWSHQSAIVCRQRLRGTFSWLPHVNMSKSRYLHTALKYSVY